MSDDQILINLDEERDAYIVNDPANMVHMRALSLIRDRIGESLDNAKKYANDRQKDGSSLIRIRRHDTIMLAGVRGSGKTTFMLSLLNFIENKLSGAEAYHFDGDIASLHILDPTLIEDKTHIFINIISMIKEKVVEKAKKINCFSDDKSESSRNYKDWEISFRELAEGLPSINGVGSDGFATESWLDSEYIMDKGVRMAQAANNLEKAFHEFVRQSRMALV
jgi:energy-coupling factor transporter ATP-binding protein EcfA2